MGYVYCTVQRSILGLTEHPDIGPSFCQGSAVALSTPALSFTKENDRPHPTSSTSACSPLIDLALLHPDVASRHPCSMIVSTYD